MERSFKVQTSEGQKQEDSKVGEKIVRWTGTLLLKLKKETARKRTRDREREKKRKIQITIRLTSWDSPEDERATHM